MRIREYTEFIGETSKETLEKVSEEVNRLGEPSLGEFTRGYFEERMNRPWAQRCSVMRASYEAVVPDGNWRDILPGMVGIELWFMADHMTNDVFDDKFERNPRLTSKYGKDVILYFMASAVLREVAERCFRESTRNINPSTENEVTEIFNEIVRGAYMHQWIDYFELKKDKVDFNELKTHYEELFKRRYLDYEAGNQFGKIAKIPAILAEAPTEQLDALEQYGRCLSTTIQIANDIADLGDEWFFDRRNGILTLPLIDISLEIGRYCYDMPQEQIRKTFIERGIFQKERRTIIMYVNKAKKALRKVFEKERRGSLESLLVSSLYNRFYKVLLSDFNRKYLVMPHQMENRRIK